MAQGNVETPTHLEMMQLMQFFSSVAPSDAIVRRQHAESIQALLFDHLIFINPCLNSWFLSQY
jgi:hypothetical protein